MTNLTPQARRQARTRQELIQNAAQMLIEHGTAGLTIRALADSIDYTPGALYKYFSSKDELIDAVRADCFNNLNAFIAERIQTAANPADMLLEGGMAYIEYAAQNPQEYHLMFNMEPSHATSQEQRDTAMQMLLQIVQVGIEQGAFQPQGAYDAAAIATHCWATVHGMAGLYTAVLRDDDDLTAVSRIILQKVIDGFTVHKTETI